MYEKRSPSVSRRLVVRICLLVGASCLCVAGCWTCIGHVSRAASTRTFHNLIADALNDGDWHTAERLARNAEESIPDVPPSLAAVLTGAYWRAGKIEDAERVAANIPVSTYDRCALFFLSKMHLARGERKQAGKFADRLASLGSDSAAHWIQIAQARLACDQVAGAADAFREAAGFLAEEGLAEGSSDELLTVEVEHLKGMAEFHHAIGADPLNQIRQYGIAPMTSDAESDVPACDVLINKHGPYRLSIDTGAGGHLVLARDVAQEAGVLPLARIARTDVLQQGQTAHIGLAEDVTIGEGAVRRVPATILPWPRPSEGDDVGSLGLGVLARGRVILDFESNTVTLARSSDDDASGSELRLRTLHDYTPIIPVHVQGQQVQALLDTGWSSIRTVEPRAQEPVWLSAVQVYLSRSKFDRLFPDRPLQTFEAGVDSFGKIQIQEMSYGLHVELTCGGRVFRDAIGVRQPFLDNIISPVAYVQTDAMVGMSVLGNAKSLTIDYPRCRAWIEWL